MSDQRRIHAHGRLAAAALAVLILCTACGAGRAPTTTPAPTSTPAPAPTATVTFSPTPPPSPSPTDTPAVTPTDTPVPATPTATPTTRPTATPTPAPTSQALSKSVVPAEIDRGRLGRHQICLTFDAGASAEPLPRILAALGQAGIRTTFFLTGDWAQQNPDSVRAIIAAGHEIANHSVTHTDFTTLSDADIVTELKDTEAILRSITGQSMLPFFRPPYGARDRRVLAAAWSAGYRLVYWTIDSGDWVEGATAGGVLNTILSKAVDGAIVVEHVGSPQSAEALPRIIGGLKEKGFEIVPLSALVQ
jgi:peptidoglycan-N-acetylglucosamine deacetylase